MQRWQGLFYDEKEGFYIAHTKLTFLRVKDEILDEEDGQKTGWEIESDRKNQSWLLLSKIKLKEGPISYIKPEIKHLIYAKNLTKEELQGKKPTEFSILPGEEISFYYNQIKYRLYATGEKQEVNKHWFPTKDYRLFIEVIDENAKKTTQMLCNISQFDDRQVMIHWIGDLDQDGKIDLLVDLSNHYNMFDLNVFLSSKAAQGELLYFFGQCLTIGC